MSSSSTAVLVSELQKTLLVQLSNAQKTDKYHDLIISCKGTEWRVHRVIVCTQSEYFEKACQTGLKEGKTGRIDLKEEDPAMIDRLVNYLYKCNYDDYATLPLTNSQRQFPAEYPIQTRQLACIVDMYVRGDRYQIAGLKDLSKAKFSAALPNRWNKENLLDVIWTIYDNTVSSDRGLRDCLTPILREHAPELRSHAAFKNMLKNQEFATDFIEAWTSSDRQGPQAAFRQCPSCNKLFSWDAKLKCGCNVQPRNFRILHLES
ncbi:MAG: hypothetical protein Q9209_005331 [Squamulea sp. 1 TL-2023]